jgi:hypothetical protein
LHYLSGAVFVTIGPLVIISGGLLFTSPLVGGISPDTEFVEVGGFEELFPQPATATTVATNAAAVRDVRIFIITFSFVAGLCKPILQVI